MLEQILVSIFVCAHKLNLFPLNFLFTLLSFAPLERGNVHSVALAKQGAYQLEVTQSCFLNFV